MHTQRLQDDEMGDDPLLDDFKVLRRRIFHWHGEELKLPMLHTPFSSLSPLEGSGTTPLAPASTSSLCVRILSS